MGGFNLGGVGAGLVAGSQLIRQQQNDEANNRFREESLGLQRRQLDNQNTQLQMQQDLHGVKTGEAKRLQADQELGDWMNQQYRDTYARTDLDDWGKASSFAQAILPKAKAEHIEAANKAAEGMRQKFGVTAVEQLKGGDVSGIQRILSQRAPGTTIKAGDGAYDIVSGGKVLQQIDRNGLMSMLALSEAANNEAAQRKAKIEADNKIADTAAKNSIAYKNRMLPFGVSGGTRSSGGKSGADAHPAKSPDWLKMAGEVAAVDPNTQKADPGAVSRIAANAESMYQSNPALFESPNQTLQVARDIEAGTLPVFPIWNSATNTYTKGVKFGAGQISIGGAHDIDPMQFYGHLTPEQQKVEQQKVLANDRQWLAGMLGRLPPDQRDSLSQAIMAAEGMGTATPEGIADRTQILSDVQKFRAAKSPLPAELAIKYSALQTAARLDMYGEKAPGKEKSSAGRSEPVTREDIERHERIQRERAERSIAKSSKEDDERRAQRRERLAQREREADAINSLYRR